MFPGNVLFSIVPKQKSIHVIYTGWGIKISHFSKGHCASCSVGREVGVVSCGWLASTIVSTHNGVDR